MLTACKNLSLPDIVNYVYIGIVSFFWLLSNLEMFLEAKSSFMPWNKFHVRRSKEAMEALYGPENLEDCEVSENKSWSK